MSKLFLLALYLISILYFPLLGSNLSILKSLMSLITHPQDLTSIDPIMTIKNSLKPIFELNPEISKPRSDGHNKR